MALTESRMAHLGSPCPDFHLPGTEGRSWRRDDFQEAALLLVVMCNHCPYVQAVDDRINALAKDFKGKCAVVGINPNDAQAYPEDSFEAMQERARRKGYVFPYLRDEAQDLARGLGALCTPDFFLFDQDRKLVYRGRLDDNWKQPESVTRQDLRRDLTSLLEGRSVDPEQRPSLGCSIKWKT